MERQSLSALISAIAIPGIYATCFPVLETYIVPFAVIYYETSLHKSFRSIPPD